MNKNVVNSILWFLNGVNLSHFLTNWLNASGPSYPDAEASAWWGIFLVFQFIVVGLSFLRSKIITGVVLLLNGLIACALIVYPLMVWFFS